MASLVLGAVGTALGGSLYGGTFLGLSGAAIGGMVGSAAGTWLDSRLLAVGTPDQRVEGPRLESLAVTTSTEGAVIPRLYGRMRLGGNIIWATDFREVKRTTTQTSGGGKGGGGGEVRTTSTSYHYYASFAVALCEGVEEGDDRGITGIGRIWADGKPMDLSGVTWRWYPGDEDQEPDPFIAATMGAGETPAYRGTAYVVFEDLALGRYGNRLPQLSFEVFRPLADPDTAEGLVRAVTMIPASGEFAYATEGIRKPGGSRTAENMNAVADSADMVVALDRLQAMAPKVESVSLVVAWFGDDLRAGECTIRPGVEAASKTTSPKTWSVNGVSRANAHLVSRDAESRSAFGGTPADFAVVQAIREMKARGLRVTFYPFLLMDVPPDNTLPNPYSDHASEAGQPAFPWRGRITCAPAAGHAGSVDRTDTAAAQVAAFFGSATPSDFAVSGTSVSWTGAAGEWGLRRMVLHYAHLCAAAGGVDSFLIGSEMRGLTTLRSGAGTYPAVQILRDLAADVRSILGGATQISYAADWSEYYGHQPADSSGDVYFHLDPLWADPEIDFVGIDNYMPLSDWRGGFDHIDAVEGWPAIHDRAYLQANVAGGEGYDWFYASAADRAAQVRTPITDGEAGSATGSSDPPNAGKPWVFRYKDLLAWWSDPHHDRPGGVESDTPTAWVPRSKPIHFTDLGCPAIDRGTNQPNVFVDPKSSEGGKPYFSRGWRDDAIQRAALEATYLYWGEAANNPASPVYGGPMVDVPNCAAWTWDARPHPFFPALTDVWSDGANWRLGHWLTGRLGSVSLAALVRHLCRRAGLPEDQIDVTGLWGAVEGYAIAALESPRSGLSMLARHFGFDAVESEGVLRFVMRGRAPATTITPDELVAAPEGGEALEIVRTQETELPQALKWQLARSDEEYDTNLVEARRITVAAARVAAETFPVAVPPESAQRRCRRALMEAWTGRETVRLRLSPSHLALDPGDVVQLETEERSLELRIAAVADGESRGVEAVVSDRAVYDNLPFGAPRAASPARPTTFGATTALVLDLPQLASDTPAHQPLLAAHAQPWPGQVAIWRAPGADDFRLLATLESRATIGTLAEPLPAGPVARFDHASALVVDLEGGTLASVTDAALFLGDNALAVESAPGSWEVVQAGRAELVAAGRYRLTRLLRGQRGTEGAMADLVPAGARVVVLADGPVPLPVAEAEIGLAQTWRVGPASRAITDESYAAMDVTPRGEGLRPFSVVHVEQPWRRSRTPGDLAIRWTRRDRAPAAESFEAAEVPLSEESEAYEVDVVANGAVKRTLATKTSSVLYTRAQQSADWGRLLGPGDALELRIAQLSARLGRGQERIVTLTF